MRGELQVRLELHDDAHNHHRFYELAVRGRADLFSGPSVLVRYGRVGTRGHSLQLSFDTLDDAIREAASRLQRRSTAERRLGARYQLVSISAPEHLANFAERTQKAFGS